MRLGFLARGWVRLESAVGAVVRGGYVAWAVPLLLGWALAATFGSLSPAMWAWIHKKYGGLALMALGGILFASLILILQRWRRRLGGNDSLAETSRWLGGRLAFLGAAPMLLVLRGGLESKHPFQVLAYSVLAAACVGVSVYCWSTEREPFERPLSNSPRWQAWAAAAALTLLVGAYCWVFANLSINNHLSFNTGRADLGFYVNILRRSSLGDPLGCTLCGGGNHLSGHFDPILVLLSPSFWILPKAQTALVLQALWLGSSAIPLFLTGRHFGLGRVQSLLLCLVLYAYPALHGANLFDFHSLVLLVPLMLWWLWSWQTDSKRLFWLMFALVLLTREDAALVAVFVGLFVMTSGRRGAIRTGLISIGIACGYFLFVKTALMANADPLRPGKGRGYAYYYSSLVPKGQGTAGLVNSVLSDPAALLKTVFTERKLLFVLQILVPVGLLPLVARRGKVLLVYGFAFTLLASREFVPTMHFHYASLLVPFVFFLTAMVLGHWRSGGDGSRFTRVPFGLSGPAMSNAALAFILVTGSVAGWKFGGVVPNKTFKAGFKRLERDPSEKQIATSALLDDFCKTAPKGKTVAAASSLLPHLARCPAIVLRGKRFGADLLVWRGGKAKDNRRIEREIQKRALVEVADLGGGYRVFETHYSKERRQGRATASKGTATSKRAKNVKKGKRPKSKRPRAPADAKPRRLERKKSPESKPAKYEPKGDVKH